LKSSNECKSGDVSGWEYTLVAKDGSMAGHVRSFFVGDRLFQIMYLGPVGSENGKECMHFLDSFRLLR
jgi:hypothetical protein